MFYACSEFVLISSRITALGGHDASPGPKPGRATGRPVQALPNTLIVKLSRPQDRFMATSASFTRLVAALAQPTSFERAFQSNLASPLRQPLGSPFFFDFRHAVPSVNSFNLNHLPFFAKGLTASFRHLVRARLRLSDSPKEYQP